jgi:hypothetical protein
MKQLEDIDLTVHETFDRRWRVAEAIIIGLMAVICLAALSGALGSGPLSHARISFNSTNPSTLEYERIGRAHNSSWMRIALAKGTTGIFPVHLDRDLLQSVSIDSTSPLPLSVRADGDGVTYLFDTRDLQGASLDFKVSPYHFGIVSTTISAHGAQASFHQLILP